MFILGNFLIALAQIVDLILTMAYWLILIRALLSWVNPDPFNPVVQFLYRTTEPLLEPVRRRLPMGRVDFSAIVVFLVIIFLQGFLVASLKDVGYRLRNPKVNDSFGVSVLDSSQGSEPFRPR